MRYYLLLLLLCVPLLMGSSFKGAGKFAVQAGAGASSPACSWSTVWDAEIVSGDTSWLNYGAGDRNSRIYVLSGDTTGSGTKIRLTVKAEANTDTTIDDAAIGPKKASSDPYDYSASATNITFSSNDAVTIGAGLTQVSDEITFTFSTSTDYIVSLYSATGDMPYLDYVGTGARKDSVGSDETETVDVSTYVSSDYLEWLVKIEACN